jgi:transposase
LSFRVVKQVHFNGKILKLPNDIKSCHEIILAQQELIEKLILQVQQMKGLSEQVKELSSQVKKLEAQLKQNSSNSNRPPSSDGYSKKPALPRGKGKKQGGQPGHKGKTLDIESNPDHIVEYNPGYCTCGCSLADVEKRTIERRQVFDLPQPKLEITEHRLQSCICPDCQRVNTGVFPQEVPARVQYGSNVRSLTVLLNTGFKLPFSKIRQFFNDVFGYELNESTQITAQQKCYEALEGAEQNIQKQLLASLVNHFDETGMRVAGKLHWLHNCSNPQYTYLFIHSKRGKKAMDDEVSLLPRYKGWAVHDCWQSYFKYSDCRHATCGAHLLRELQGLIEQGSIWADRMHDLLLYAYEKSDYGRGVVPDLSFINRRYIQICQMADEEEPSPEYRFKGRKPKRTKGRNLLDRLVKYEDAVLAFAQYSEIPFTNNQAERDVRPAKIKQKVSGCFRTFNGAQVYARIQSFISTTRKHQLNVFNELVATLNGYNFLTAPEGAK